MKPKEKANKLWYKFYNKLEHTFNNQYDKYAKEICKELALLCIDEIIKELHKADKGYNLIDRIEYWGLVKDELNKF